MLRPFRRFADSCRLDRGGSSVEFGAVDRALAEGAPRTMPPPRLRSAIMESLRTCEQDARTGPSWGLVALACILVCGVSVALVQLRSTPAPAPAFTGLPIPVDAGPVFRLVSGSVDKPLLDQAQKMYDDTRRATKLVASCVPFARRGG